MDKSLSTFNIVNGICLYETRKKDLHTLLVKESKEVFDYEGDVEMEAGLVKFEYEPSIALNMDYDSSITIVRTIKYMLKHDIMLWDKTQGISKLFVLTMRFRDDGGFKVVICFNSKEENKGGDYYVS